MFYEFNNSVSLKIIEYEKIINYYCIVCCLIAQFVCNGSGCD
ncbi:hypothetical protein CCAND95_130087 [Capnocytophaga canis]|nr:hypothetical protein CCAND95_130087 [Capnocytophaga canis]